LARFDAQLHATLHDARFEGYQQDGEPSRIRQSRHANTRTLPPPSGGRKPIEVPLSTASTIHQRGHRGFRLIRGDRVVVNRATL
jgi:hypothetical protein